MECFVDGKNFSADAYQMKNEEELLGFNSNKDVPTEDVLNGISTDLRSINVLVL